MKGNTSSMLQDVKIPATGLYSISLRMTPGSTGPVAVDTVTLTVRTQQ